MSYQKYQNSYQRRNVKCYQLLRATNSLHKRGMDETLRELSNLSNYSLEKHTLCRNTGGAPK